MKTRKKLLSEIRRLTKIGYGGHKKMLEKIKQNHIKHHIPKLSDLPNGLRQLPLTPVTKKHN